MSDTAANPSNRQDLPLCDLVMKGGITSGVVYPGAVAEIAKSYRLKGIGGASAGAIAAALTAAAEYGREVRDAEGCGGFDRLAALPAEIAPKLLEKFQPDPPFKPLFGLFTALLGRARWKMGHVLCRALAGYPGSTLGIIAAGAIASVLLWRYDAIGWGAFAILVTVVALAAVTTCRLAATVARLAHADFGLCSMKTQPGAPGPALTDWLTEAIDRVAGRKRTDTPLTFGDLADTSGGRHGVQLSVMTSDLMTRRPYSLPFTGHEHYFSEREFRRLFPDRVVDAMVAKSTALPDGRQTGPKDLRYMPAPEHLPVVVAARMSLSFPLLIQAVPLWKCDYTLATRQAQRTPRRCLFSDGGLTSNFPIHFFDRLLPNTPTFAISLGAYAAERDRTGVASDAARIHMPVKAQDGLFLPIAPIAGLGGFAMRLLDTAKDWQDNLQSILPGHRDRIVRIDLKDDEGGINLTMPPETVKRLNDLGVLAGKRVTTKPAAGGFSLDNHRWTRFLVAMSRMERSLGEIDAAYDGGPDVPGFAEFFRRYRFGGFYKPESAEWKDLLLNRADTLRDLGAEWAAKPNIATGKAVPRADTIMRVTPRF